MNSIVRRLADRRPLQGLKPVRVWDTGLDEEIAVAAEKWTESIGAGRRADALAFRSGLHLWNDSLDASHSISQDVHTSTGSYWHGIMHRMEGDYGNAKYWFRQTRSHPVFAELRAAVSAMGGEDEVRLRNAGLDESSEWDPYRFVDAVEEQVTGGGTSSEDIARLLERIQRCEIGFLLRFSCRSAAGETILSDWPDV